MDDMGALFESLVAASGVMAWPVLAPGPESHRCIRDTGTQHLGSSPPAPPAGLGGSPGGAQGPGAAAAAGAVTPQSDKFGAAGSAGGQQP